MAGSKFQYDENGGTFFYFLLSFLVLVIVPCTYHFWPQREPQEDDKGKKKCRCDACNYKVGHMRANEPGKRGRHRLIKLLLLLGWVAIIATAYKVTTIQNDYVAWDPYEILGIETGASVKEIKKAYHKLSLVFHPDKETGDEKKFVRITKAYAALTDETSRKNWETYGNPDGPGATSLGIALPSWIVEKENSYVVLGLYSLVFLIGLPLLVGIWWYNSIKYAMEEVLMDTTSLYYYVLYKSPFMNFKRALMIVAASFEFHKEHNKEVQERPSDDAELVPLLRELPSVNEKNKEKPMCLPYAVKARLLIYAHLNRMKLNPLTLDQDRMYIIKKCPNLIAAFVQMIAHMKTLASAGRLQRGPTLDTLESTMRLCPHIVQAITESKSPLLQLPHLNEGMLRYLTTKKRSIRSLAQLAEMREEERRSMLRSLSDSQYEDIMVVLGNMPLLELFTTTEVFDDENSKFISAGSVITITVTLVRKAMSELFTVGDSEANKTEEDAPVEEEVKAAPVWVSKSKKGKKKNLALKKVLKQMTAKATTNPEPEPEPELNDDVGDDGHDTPDTLDKDNSDEDEVQGREPREGGESDVESVGGDSESAKGNGDGDQSFDDDLDEELPRQKKKTPLEGIKKISHSVHCPYYADDKQEFWWIYVVDKKKQELRTNPVLMTNLVDEESVELKLIAPSTPGSYSYTVVVRSDSYIDVCVTKIIKLDVKDAVIVNEHPQWEMSDDEGEEQKEEEESACEDSDLLDDSDLEDAAASDNEE